MDLDVLAALAHGGWLAVPLPALLGLLAALLHRGAVAALSCAPRPATTAAVVFLWCPPTARATRATGPSLGGRGPPALAG